MKIPKRFMLGGLKWEVKIRPIVKDFGALGLCCMDKAVIKIDSSLSSQMKEKVFCHELVHAIKDSMGEREHDEEKVDAFASYLHQYLIQLDDQT